MLRETFVKTDSFKKDEKNENVLKFQNDWNIWRKKNRLLVKVATLNIIKNNIKVFKQYYCEQDCSFINFL